MLITRAKNFTNKTIQKVSSTIDHVLNKVNTAKRLNNRKNSLTHL